MVADFRSVPESFKKIKQYEIDKNIKFDLFFCYSKDEFLKQINEDYLYLVFFDEDIDGTQILNELQLNKVDPRRYRLEFKPVTKDSGSRLFSRVTALIKQQCVLGNGGGELIIDPRWIKKLDLYNELLYTEAQNE